MSGKYQARTDDIGAQMGDLDRRIARLETSLKGSMPASVGVVTNTDFLTPPVTTTSTSFVIAYYLWPNGDRQGIECYLRVITPAAVTMEVRLIDDSGGAVISPVAVIPAAHNGYLGLRGRNISGLTLLAARVEFRVASGAGTIRVGLLRAQSGNFESETF